MSSAFPSLEQVEDLSRKGTEPEWFKRHRVASHRLYHELPLEKSPLYSRYVNALGSLNLDSINSLQEEGHIDVPSHITDQLSSTVGGVVQVDERVADIQLDNELASEGVIFKDLFSALIDHEDLLKSCFIEKAIPPEDDKFAALNQALVNTGVFLYVPKGLEIPLPFRSISLMKTPGKGVFSNIIILVDEGAKVSFMDEGYSFGTQEDMNPSVYSNVVEIYLREGAQIGFYTIQAYEGQVTYLVNKRAICGKDSEVTWTAAYLAASATRSKLDSRLDGPGATTSSIEVVFGNNQQRFDLVSDLTHRQPNTTGSAIVRGIMKDSAQSIFKGMIRISKEAKNSRAYIGEHAMLLDPDAKANAIPGLEVATNEVKATHAASVAQLDQEVAFYLMSRGLSRSETLRTLVLGFFEPAVQRIPVKEVRATVRHLIREKWYGSITPYDLTEDDLMEGPEEVVETKPSERKLFDLHYKYRKQTV